jgi:CHASE2 domain-containing sensor protein
MDRKEVWPPLAWAVERASLRGEEEFSVSEFLIDYAPLEQLIAQRVIADRAADVARQADRIAGRIVLVGRAAPGRTTDQFNVPGRGMPVPGIFLHASAVYTLLQAPLYRLTHAGRVAADALAALLVFGPVFLLRIGWRSRTGRDLAAYRLHAVVTAAVVVAVIVVGHFLVSDIRLIWTDYLMVVGALLVHSPAERRIGAAAGWVRGCFLLARARRSSMNTKKKGMPR